MRHRVINKCNQVIGSKQVMNDLAIASTSAMEGGGQTQSIWETANILVSV